MRKNNKKLMIVVSVLLSLVLITSSVVSGTMAKYVTSGNSSSSARVAKWGVNVEVDFSDEVKTLCKDANQDGTLDELVPVAKDGVLTVTLPNLPMAPGVDFTDAILLKISGSPEVKCKLKIDFSLEYTKSGDAFIIPPEIMGTNNSMIRTPFGYTFSYKPSTASGYIKTIPMKAWNTGTWQDNDKNATQYIANSVIDMTAINADNTGSCNYWLEKNFTPNESIVFHPRKADKTIDKTVNVNDIAFGWYWPFEHSSNDYFDDGNIYNYNAIDEWIVKNQPNVVLKFTVSIEQVQ